MPIRRHDQRPESSALYQIDDVQMCSNCCQPLPPEPMVSGIGERFCSMECLQSFEEEECNNDGEPEDPDSGLEEYYPLLYQG